MDNVFEILIYAVIIISFISSFFKKKPKEEPQKTRETRSNESTDISEYNSEPVIQKKKEVDDYDILREIENMFKMETQPKPAPVPNKVEPIKKSQPAVKSETKRIAAENDVTVSEHAKSKSISYDISDNKRKPQLSSKIDYGKDFHLTKQIPDPFLDLKRKLKEPKNVRDFIVISEIIGKPKALRR
jgi:hypothetical protein